MRQKSKDINKLLQRHPEKEEFSVFSGHEKFVDVHVTFVHVVYKMILVFLFWCEKRVASPMSS
jgi:hypothetical protein